MAFRNSIKKLDQWAKVVGVVPSIEGNERTLAANAALKERHHVLKAKPEPQKPASRKLDAWEKELQRLGF